EIALGEAVTAQVDVPNRLDASRNHSGTHLLHAALRSVLGLHVRQAGSLVTPERLRFDFSHVSALSFQELRSVQRMANEKIRDNLRVSSQETSYAEAVRQGALAFFGDRYGDVVRVVTIENSGEDPGETDVPFSMEVCGGTHVSATGQVGTLLVLGESSIGGGMRRIEAISGRAAEELFLEQSDRLTALSQKLQTPVADLESRLDSYMQETEELKNRLETLERATLRSEAERLLERVDDVDGVKLVAARTSATNPEGMREMGDFLKAKLSSVAVVLGAVVEGNPILVAMVSPDLVERGLHAGNLARDTAKVMGGGGGGRADMAQAGGRQPEKLDEALRGVADLVRKGLAS
ncbi:MAG: alanine--tRNA ligase, partial [Chloroflexi bacterium]|nr:alanine--tRNA ligase [Chloroflexota bacterium]